MRNYYFLVEFIYEIGVLKYYISGLAPMEVKILPIFLREIEADSGSTAVVKNHCRATKKNTSHLNSAFIMITC
ncbi:hypothetical protein DOS84_03185 [Flavobacterium aquariorum]|uniref:Uncharacterized protein n=1 Tax=Flavobacterium aquariorum TaxID=2217670 RepID=A0A2W7UMH2_9FLAO|nr:hypothetical protein DOS84_03185 [Flavobacterium aquariorum]